MHYSIVDCRPVVHFSCGHLPDSHNLDANLVREGWVGEGRCMRCHTYRGAELLDNLPEICR